MANAYLDRMEQLNGKRVQSNVRQLSQMAGLPVQRPGDNGATASPSGVPTGNNPMPQEDESYKKSTFFTNFNSHQNEDEHFGAFSDELTKLATGLRKQVEQGYMPQSIAEDNLRQFIGDTVQRRAMANPHIERQTAQRNMEKVFTAYANKASQNPTPDSPIAQRAAEAQQQAQDNPPAIQQMS